MFREPQTDQFIFRVRWRTARDLLFALSSLVDQRRRDRRPEEALVGGSGLTT
jgi:hypothetical protein